MADAAPDVEDSGVVLVVGPEEPARVLRRDAVVVHLERAAEVQPCLGHVREDSVDVPPHSLGGYCEKTTSQCRRSARHAPPSCILGRSRSTPSASFPTPGTPCGMPRRQRSRARRSPSRTRRRCSRSISARRWCLHRCTTVGSRAGAPLRRGGRWDATGRG